MKVSRSAMLAAAAAVVLSASACTSVEGGAGASSNSSSSSSSSEAAPQSSESSSEQTQASSSAPESSSQSEPSESSSSSESSSEDPGSGSEGQSGLVRAKVGEEAKTGDMTVKISKVVDPVPVSSDSFMKPDAGKRWVAVNMSVTNTSSKPLNFSTLFCVDAKTDQNQTADDSLFSDYGTKFNSSALQKGDTAVGDITFEVPTGQKLKQVDVKCSLSSLQGDQRAIRIDVSK